MIKDIFKFNIENKQIEAVFPDKSTQILDKAMCYSLAEKLQYIREGKAKETNTVLLESFNGNVLTIKKGNFSIIVYYKNEWWFSVIDSMLLENFLYTQRESDYLLL